ncbi:N-acetylglucosamine kinase [Longimycelium tulufanense]|uniref:N-acetylglucosamine kinase n=1 Tax=Longimycelium tulufanense TaxID=907463 RepID=A0A8J3CC07_9PSEU|nr:BadF/BadG/BcrA/BcrD ATPase family protein [Longimycelium tulufanense]GGM44054.1 N-acetylglucosamine kinase [Longimycelium tulufanense]
MSALVVGLDVGGTSTRAVVADLAGRRLGAAQGPGGNPNAYPPEQAAAHVGRTLREALRDANPAEVAAGVLAMAGASKLTDPMVRAMFELAWRESGLRCAFRVALDVEAGFAAGTSEPTGTALVAGTGSVACRIVDHRRFRTVGGHGWLLGDEGSAFWLGREAVRHTLHAVEHRGRWTSLVDSVLSTALGDWSDPWEARNRLISLVNGAKPVALAEYAPLVTDAARTGDKSAGTIVDTAATHLADLVTATREPDDASPVVLIGGLTARENPVGSALRAKLGRYDIRTATDGAAGAAWLAALDLADDPVALHAVLVP